MKLQKHDTYNKSGLVAVHSIDDLLEYCRKEQRKWERVSVVCEECNEPRASAIAQGRSGAMADLLELLVAVGQISPHENLDKSDR
jgi:hypothetical protein